MAFFWNPRVNNFSPTKLFTVAAGVMTRLGREEDETQREREKMEPNQNLEREEKAEEKRRGLWGELQGYEGRETQQRNGAH